MAETTWGSWSKASTWYCSELDPKESAWGGQEPSAGEIPALQSQLDLGCLCVCKHVNQHVCTHVNVCE